MQARAGNNCRRNPIMSDVRATAHPNINIYIYLYTCVCAYAGMKLGYLMALIHGYAFVVLKIGCCYDFTAMK